MHEQDMVDKERKTNQRQRVQDVDLEDLQDVRSTNYTPPYARPASTPAGSECGGPFGISATFPGLAHTCPGPLCRVLP